MPLIREEMALTHEQVGNLVIASVSMTVFARVVVGRICDRLGPRKTYTGLLIFGSLPVMGIGLCESYESLLVARLLIGCTGASFVVTQFHTNAMFAPNVVGTANATSAGWGNLGASVSQVAMPLLLAALLSLGIVESTAWRLAMVAPGLLMLTWAPLYWRFTQDRPEGEGLRGAPVQAPTGGGTKAVLSDHRVWILALVYGASFGVELTLNNVAVLYFTDDFGLGLASAGLLAGLFGSLNLFARSLGGAFADRAGLVWGLRGRVRFLCISLALEALALAWMARSPTLATAVGGMLVFSLFVKVAQGGTFAVVPFVQSKNFGLVAGLVGAGGNLGAVAAGFLFRSETFSYSDAFVTMAIVIFACAGTATLIRFTQEEERESRLRLVGVLPHQRASSTGSLSLARRHEVVTGGVDQFHGLVKETPVVVGVTHTPEDPVREHRDELTQAHGVL